MRRLVFLLLATLLLALPGCVSLDPQDRHNIELTPNQLHRGFLGPGTQRYTFTLEAPSQVLLESRTPPLRPTPIGPNARLLNAEGQIVARDWQSGRERNFRLDIRLPAGVWFLDIDDPITCRSWRCDDGDRSFTLIFEAEPLP